ncbi:MAG: helix-turn-helix transcriptional regulator [Muribaculaceae bacterium]|nr:helix-turn-helix transcriptional regulator [Muribaculaceae bacterium]
MALIQANTHLSDVILSEPGIIPVINRFGILLGTGDSTVSEICGKHGLDIEFFLTILNTYINEEYFPEKILKSFCASTIVTYLQKTYASYLHFQLPNIERHFHLLIERSGTNNNLGLMLKFFNELKQDLTDRIAFDNEQWFPSILSAGKGKPTDTHGTVDAWDSTTIEDKLNDLKSMFVIHLSGSYDLNLCHGVIVALITLEKDIRQNDRIRDRILIPIHRSITNSNSQS